MNGSYQSEISRARISINLDPYASSYSVSLTFREMKGVKPEQITRQLPPRRAILAC